MILCHQLSWPLNIFIGEIYLNQNAGIFKFENNSMNLVVAYVNIGPRKGITYRRVCDDPKLGVVALFETHRHPKQINVSPRQ